MERRLLIGRIAAKRSLRALEFQQAQRGSRSLAIKQLIFLSRQARSLTARLLTPILSWKSAGFDSLLRWSAQ
jgi:hypothetical protein